MTRFAGPLLVAVLGLVFFAPLLRHPTQVLYSDHSDLLAEHIPAKRFLVGSYHADGELPRWCPDLYCGGPFLHDIQIGAFYPPHAILYLLPEDAVGPTLSWLVVAHVVAAGLLTYAYARWSGLGRAGAAVAAVGYMFAGKWLLHLLGAGHYITIGLAWLPLAVLCLEHAVRNGSVLSATWAGLVYGLMALGTQPQWTFYAGLFLGAWTLAVAGEQPGGLRFAVRGVLFGAWVAILAVALAAVQLFPTVELASHSTRSGGVDFGDLVSGGVRSVLFFVGPSLTAEPFELEWEDRGGFGVLWVVAAAAAPLLRPDDRRTRWRFVVLVAMCLFAFGGSVLFQWLPGFHLFRQHARMIMIATFPIAFLAGVTTDTLLKATAEGRSALLVRCRWVLVRVVIAVAILCGLYAVRLVLVEQKPLRFHPYWVSLLLTVPLTFWLFSGGLAGKARGGVLWAAVLLIDLWALAWPLVRVRPESETFPLSESVRYLAEEGRPRGRVLDRDTAENVASPLGRGAPMAVAHGIEAVRGYTPLDLLRFKEYLLFVMDRDLPLRPLMQDADAVRADPTLAGDASGTDREAVRGLTYPVMQNLPVVNRNLFDLLQVRYLLQPAGEPLPGPNWQGVFLDPAPRACDFGAGGVRELPPYKVLENRTVMERAFVVPHAAPLPERPQVLPVMKQTDFRTTVLLEPAGAVPAPIGGSPSETFRRAATVERYRPNEVVVRVADGPPGYLVLTDVWFPGWTCTVDGEPRTVHRANYLFRAVPIEAGEHQVTFRFEPTALARGWAVSLGALVLIGGVHLLWLTARLFGGRRLRVTADVNRGSVQSVT